MTENQKSRPESVSVTTNMLPPYQASVSTPPLLPLSTEAGRPPNPPQPAPRCSRTSPNNANNKGVRKVATVSLGPFRGIRQAWKDYRNGRMIRKRGDRNSPFDRSGGGQHDKDHIRVNARHNPDPNEENIRQDPEPGTERKQRGTPRNGRDNRRCCRKGGWEYQDGEFPWRLERVIQKGENWRGTWVLEVKDLWAMEWKREYYPSGSQWRLRTIPQPHWPFPNDQRPKAPRSREPDELRDWLERP